MSDYLSGELIRKLAGRQTAAERLVREQTDIMFAREGLVRADPRRQTKVRDLADAVGSDEADALADRYDAFMVRMDEWIEARQPRGMPDRWWDVARNEIMYRIETWAWPLGSADVMRLYDWLMTTFAREMTKLIRRYGGTEAEKELAARTLDELMQFLDLWRPTVLAGLKATGSTGREAVRVFVVKVIKEVVRMLLKLLYNGVVLVLGVVIRVLKSIPYTFWLGYILGYVLAVVYTAQKVLPG